MSEVDAEGYVIFPPVDYPRRNYEWQRHHERYVRHVETMPRKLPCQECGGMGEEVADRFDFGGDDVGPIMFNLYEPCGFCEGTGLLTPWMRGWWLSMKKAEKRGRYD
jgi:hypothetical protein